MIPTLLGITLVCFVIINLAPGSPIQQKLLDLRFGGAMGGVDTSSLSGERGDQGVPKEVIEAAQIDGANAWRRFWNVTVPVISPVVFFNLVMGIIGSFQVFTAAFIMTRGGPQNATLFIVLWIYRNAFELFKMGYAATLAWALFLIIMVFTILQFSVANRWVYYEGKV